MGEKFYCPTVRASDWKQAEPKINDTLQRLVRMLNQISTGAGIPVGRLTDPLDQPSVTDEDGNVTVSHGKLAAESDKKNLVVKMNAIIPTHAIDVDAGHLKLDDSTLLLEDIDLTIEIEESGINGLDTGFPSSGTWYSIWVIHNPTTAVTAGLFSASVTSPTMPSGYTKKRRVGWVRYGAGAFEEFYCFGDWWIYYSPRSVCSTVAAATSWTEIDCSAFVPSTSGMVLLGIEVGSDSGSMARTSIRRKGSGASSLLCLLGGRAWGVSDMRWWGLGIEMTCDANQIIEYQSHADSDILEVRIQGYYDHI